MLDPIPLLVGLCLVALFVALFVSNAAYDPVGSLLWYQSPPLWAIISSICFAVGVSGSIFCVIRSAPSYGRSRAGPIIFAGQGRDQYFVEGLIVASWTLAGAISLFIMQGATRMKRFPLLRHVVILLCLSFCVVLFQQIWAAYVMKTGWYSFRETVPNEVWVYLTGSVKKGSGLLKRLLRLSEYWLFEAKDLVALKSKAKALILDYLYRQYSRTG